MQSQPSTIGNEAGEPAPDGFLSAFVSEQRVRVEVAVSSKKRLIEEVADLLCTGAPDLDRDTVYQILNDRERLGSTGIGEGFAIPHGRINGIAQPIICALLLAQPLDFDSIDSRPVRCAIGLLVPADANQTHLQILAKLAGAFSRPDSRGAILGCASARELYDALRRLD